MSEWWVILLSFFAPVKLVTQFPHLFVWLFLLLKLQKETLFKIGKYDMKPQTPEMSEAQSNAQSCSELFLFSICKVSSWRQFKQGAAAWPLWIISLLWEYSQFLSNLSIKKFILVIQVRLVLLRCHENITGTIQRCQSIYLAPSQDSCHSS